MRVDRCRNVECVAVYKPDFSLFFAPLPFNPPPARPASIDPPAAFSRLLRLSQQVTRSDGVAAARLALLHVRRRVERRCRHPPQLTPAGAQGGPSARAYGCLTNSRARDPATKLQPRVIEVRPNLLRARGHHEARTFNHLEILSLQQSRHQKLTASSTHHRDPLVRPIYGSGDEKQPTRPHSCRPAA